MLCIGEKTKIRRWYVGGVLLSRTAMREAMTEVFQLYPEVRTRLCVDDMRWRVHVQSKEKLERSGALKEEWNKVKLEISLKDGRKRGQQQAGSFKWYFRTKLQLFCQEEGVGVTGRIDMLLFAYTWR